MEKRVFLAVALPLWVVALIRAAIRNRRQFVWTLGGPGGIDRGRVDDTVRIQQAYE